MLDLEYHRHLGIEPALVMVLEIVSRVEGETVRFLKIRLKDQCVNFFYSMDGVNWTMNERTQEVSAYTNNALGGSSYLRPAIYAKGIGKASISSFKYKQVK